jgi:hypothetical protein
MSLLDSALEYQKIGWFVLPIDPVKKQPLIKWADRKHERPEPEEIRSWFEIWPDARVGVVTGSSSGIDVVDLDGPEAYVRFEALYGMPETIMQSTGRKEGGLHLFFKHKSNDLRCSAGKDENRGIDLRTDGGIVVVAPSQHPSGECYQWLNVNPAEDGLDDLLEMPPEVVEHFQKQNGNYKDRKPITLDPVERGARNDTLTRLVGKWISKGLDHETVYLAAAGWNHKLNEPLDDKEVKTIVESIFRTHARNYPEEQIKNSKAEEITKKELFGFPHQTLAGAGGYFANVYDDSIESCPQFLFMSYLTCLGNVLCPKLSVKTSLKTQPRLYVVLVGESADDRKSTALDVCTDFFKSVLDKDFNYCEGAGSAEGLQRILKKAEEQYSDQTLGTLLVHDEFKAFVSKCNIDNSVLLPCVNTLFEKTRYQNSIKKKDILIDPAYLSMLAASTTETYERIYKPHFFHIGFPNRVFLVPGTTQRKYSLPPEIPYQEQRQMKQDLIQILKYAKDGIRFELTPEAAEYYHHWYLHRDKSVHVKRMDTYSLRLMMLLAANELKPEIDIDIAQKATALCDWQVEVRKLYDPIDADSIYAQMEEKIRRHLSNGPLKDWELKRKTGANRTGLHVYTTALGNLKRASEVGKDKDTKQWFLIRQEDFSTQFSTAENGG